MVENNTAIVTLKKQLLCHFHWDFAFTLRNQYQIVKKRPNEYVQKGCGFYHL